MTIEVLERAIQRLEELRRGSREQGYLDIGDFQPWGEQNQNGDYAESILFDKRGETLAYGLPDGTGYLIAALSRAVGPMLTILRTASRLLKSGLTSPNDIGIREAVALAKAILGEDTP